MEEPNYNIIRKLVERVVLPKYPGLKIHDIDSYFLSQNEEYDVRFRTSKKLPAEIQVEIDKEVKTLFRMAGLEEIQSGKYKPNEIKVWFKTPNAKDWSFTSTYEYTGKH
jgi:hypothetical protein